MNRKTIIIGVLVGIILVAGVGFWRWEGVKNAGTVVRKDVQQEVESKDIVDQGINSDIDNSGLENIDTRNWETYIIGSYSSGCKFLYPKEAEIYKEKSEINLEYANDNTETVFKLSEGDAWQIHLADLSGYVERPLKDYFEIIGRQLGIQDLVKTGNIEEKIDMIDERNSRAITRIEYKDKPVGFSGEWKNGTVRKYFYFNCSSGIHVIYSKFNSGRSIYAQEKIFDKIISTLEEL